MYKRNFSDDELRKIDELQKQMLQKFKTVDGKATIKYEGKKFLVFPGVFWPFEDSKPLVQNFDINPGEEVLDVGTGSGVLAIFTALKGASKVVALDINPAAVENAKANVKLHGLSDIVDVRLSDMFAALSDEEKFDVIVANLPFRDKSVKDAVEQSMWDTELLANKRFFEKVKSYLEPNGRIYFSQSNVGAVDEVLALAENKGFVVKLIGKKKMPDSDPRVFYAFELKFRVA